MQPYIPSPLLAKILSLVGVDGVQSLKNFILVGPEGRDAAMFAEALSAVRLDKDFEYVRWSDSVSPYYPLFQKCQKHKNPYALYVHSLQLGCSLGKIEEAIAILAVIKDVYPLAKLVFIMFSCCAGLKCEYNTMEVNHDYEFQELEGMGAEMIHHILIHAVKPCAMNSYKDSWSCDDYGDCWWAHEILREFNGE